MEKQALKKPRLTGLDGIKGISSIFIIFVHYVGRNPSGGFPIPFIPEIFTAKGWMFVELFFIISGFLFALSFRKKADGVGLGEYTLARLKRLYPAVLCVTVLDVAVRVLGIAVTGDGYRLTLANLIKSLTFATTIIFGEEPFPTVVWYIHALFVCYLVYFFIAKCKNARLYRILLAVMLLVGFTLYRLDLDLPFLFANLGRGLLAFSLGALLCELWQFDSKRLNTTVTLSALALSLIMGVLGLVFTFKKVFFGDMLMGFALLFFPTILLCILNLKIFERFFSLPPFVFLGKISMATFLVHVPILNLFGIINHHRVLIPFGTVWGLLIILLTIFAVAIGWYFLIERRLIPLALGALEKLLVKKE